jgi:hypothetical protein
MKNTFAVAQIALLLLLAASIAVSAQGYTTSNESINVSPSYSSGSTNATNATQSSAYAPGFEGFAALIGLISSAYLVMRRK